MDAALCEGDVCKGITGVQCANVECADGYVCEAGNTGNVCKPQMGKPCDGGYGCAEGYLCVDDECTGLPGTSCVDGGTCWADAGLCEGDVCKGITNVPCANVECADGYVCESGDSGDVCKPQMGLVCEESFGCAQGYLCVDGVCVGLSGAACASPEDCAEGESVCEEGICKGLEGAACSDSSCAQGYACEDSDCVGLQDSSCGINGQCASGYQCDFDAGALCKGVPGTGCVATGDCFEAEDGSGNLICDGPTSTCRPGEMGFCQEGDPDYGDCAEGYACEVFHCVGLQDSSCEITGHCAEGYACDPVTLLCDELDCDDAVANGDQVFCELTLGVCAGMLKNPSQCVNGEWLPCGPIDYGPDYMADESLACDGLDNDCDGEVDEGCVASASVTLSASGVIIDTGDLEGLIIVGQPSWGSAEGADGSVDLGIAPIASVEEDSP